MAFDLRTRIKIPDQARDKLFIFALLLFSMSFAVSFAEWLPEENASNYSESAVMTSSGKAVGVDSHGRIYTVWRGLFSAGLTYSDGQGWSSPEIFNYEFSHNVCLTIDDDNNVHICWEDTRENMHRMIYHRSRTRAGEWSQEISLTGSSHMAYQPFLCSASSKVHLFFWDWEAVGQKKTIAYRCLENGQWSEKRVLVDGDRFPQMHYAASDHRDWLHLVWLQTDDHEIRYMFSEGGDNWSEHMIVETDAQACGPAISISTNGTSNIVWQISNSHLFHRFYYNGAWSDVELIFEPMQSQGLIDLTNDLSNGIHLVFSGSKNTGLTSDTFYVHLKNYIWSEPIMISSLDNFSSTPPYITSDSRNNIHVVWEEKKVNPQQIYYRKYITGIPTPTPIPTVTPTATPEQPKILAAGYGDTRLFISDSNIFFVWALLSNSNSNCIHLVELKYEDLMTGVILNDEGVNGDQTAGDSIYSVRIENIGIDELFDPLLFKIVVLDSDMKVIAGWPYLHVNSER